MCVVTGHVHGSARRADRTDRRQAAEARAWCPRPDDPGAKVYNQVSGSGISEARVVNGVRLALRLPFRRSADRYLAN